MSLNFNVVLEYPVFIGSDIFISGYLTSQKYLLTVELLVRCQNFGISAQNFKDFAHCLQSWKQSQTDLNLGHLRCSLHLKKIYHWKTRATLDGAFSPYSSFNNSQYSVGVNLTRHWSVARFFFSLHNVIATRKNTFISKQYKEILIQDKFTFTNKCFLSQANTNETIISNAPLKLLVLLASYIWYIRESTLMGRTCRFEVYFIYKDTFFTALFNYVLT